MRNDLPIIGLVLIITNLESLQKHKFPCVKETNLFCVSNACGGIPSHVEPSLDIAAPARSLNMRARWPGAGVATVFTMRGARPLLLLLLVSIARAEHSARSPTNQDTREYSKILQEYLLRNFDGGSRMPNQLARQEETGSGNEEEEVEIASGSEEAEDEGDDTTVEEKEEESGSDEGSGAADSADKEEELVVLYEASYVMSSEDKGTTSVRLVLQRVESHDNSLNLVCSVTSASTELFSDPSCHPEIYLVEATDCAALPDTLNAKKLADVHEEGRGEVEVAATWDELPGKCLVLLKKKSCDSEESEDAEEEEEEEEEEIDENDAVVVESSGRSAFSNRMLTAAPRYSRSYSALSLAGFTLLSTGSSSVFTVTKTVQPSFGGVVANIVATKYDRFSTLPYLQLPGWSSGDAVIIALVMMVGYYLYAYSNADEVSLLPLKKSTNCNVIPCLHLLFNFFLSRIFIRFPNQAAGPD